MSVVRSSLYLLAVLHLISINYVRLCLNMFVFHMSLSSPYAKNRDILLLCRPKTFLLVNHGLSANILCRGML